ncbi:MAG TPA: DNA mismatch repair endonuclease MutL [Chloroflexota bacterium]|nr:DNA mismatch repair endonuclease MutL [Chloroflexota bacterium]
MAVRVPGFLAQRPAVERRPIRVLEPEVAERIAAGEVVDRPAAVVRELVENALDAGAREITVELRGGGLELIRVSDDGCGIAPDELELAFRRHATSKIAAFDDLLRLGTLGFRGEALPSVAAVAEVSVLTRVAEEEMGAALTLRGGEVVRRGRAARQPGTIVTVRQLFQNVPARLKFLPAGRAESLLVGALVRRYALAHPEARLALLLDGRPSFRSGGGGTVEGALADVYGVVVAETMLRLQAAVDGARVEGWTSGRTVTRPGRGQVTLVVNGRLAASRGLVAALEAAYRPLLPRGRHPIALIRVDVPPAELDANVHPAKSEVRLAREADVAEALARAVRETLGRAPARPSLDEEFALGPRQRPLPAPRRRVFAEGGAGYEAEPPAELLAGARVVAQVGGTLIVVEGPGGVLLIDQHRAHERVIYERLRERASVRSGAGEPAGRRAGEGQSLLEPVVLELSAAQAARLEERLPFLEALGFGCQRFGDREYLVRAVPALPEAEELASGLGELLEEAAGDADDWRDRLMTALACRAAVRRGRPLGEAEMRELVRQLAETAAPASCPHGSPVVLALSGGFLERQFGW